MPLARSLNLPPPTDQNEFEDLVADALQVRHENLHLVRFGRSGQRQNGIDGWDGANPRGLVWQATTQRTELLAKLEHDLALFDQSTMGRRSLFIFATAVQRDADLQRSVQQICEQRLDDDKCAVELLFWSDIYVRLSPATLRRYYPEFVAPDASEMTISDGLLAIGWAAVARASLVVERPNSWTLTLGEYVLGSLDDVASFIERFRPDDKSAWASFEGLGVARPLIETPTLRGRAVELTLGERSLRTNVYKTGRDIALAEDGDIFSDLRTISGFPAAVQRMSTAMSMKLGEWFLDASAGCRCAAFYEMNRDARTLGSLIATELSRLAFLPSSREQETSLPFIDRVIGVEVPSMELINGELHTMATVEMTGHGQWRGPLRIFIRRAS